jgi:hypothetical protein
MAISHVAVGTATSTTGVASLAVTLPTGWAAGDLLLLWMHWPDAITAQSLPTGWTQQVALTAEGTTSKAALYSRLAQAGDTAPTITWTTNSKPIFHCAAYRGVDRRPRSSSGGITVDTTSTTTTIVGGSVTNTGTATSGRSSSARSARLNLADKTGSITAGASGLTLRTSSNNSGAASAPWDISGTLDSAAAVTAAGHAYTLGVSGVATAAAHKMAANVYINPAATGPSRPPKPIIAESSPRSVGEQRAATW